MLILIAQTTPEPWMTSIVQLGICGAVLIWFMFRAEKKMTDIAGALDRVARVNALLVITFGSKPAKELAEAIKIETENAEAARNK